jgi:acetate kinase
VRVLVVNAGSSSLKLRVLDSWDKVTGTADLPAPRGAADAAAMESALASLGDADAVGYRIVHGGTSFTAPVRIDDGVLARLRALTDLAPLHQPKSLAAVAAVQRVLPGVPGVACFDTAFHATIPAAAATYALPREWRQRWALRRYGFHGLSHSYAARRAAELAGGGRAVTCHLGAGASLAAVRDGVSVDTTMGFTPLEGLVMATRSGSVDPGLVLWLADHGGTPAAELAAALEHRSGLLGLAGTADMREVVAGAAAGLPDARLALDVYTHRLRAGVAAMAAALGGLDVLVFTGGVGENSPVVRSEAAAGLGFLGVRLDAGRNEADGSPVDDPAGGDPAGGDPVGEDPAGGSSAADREIGDPGAPVRSFVIAAREDIEIAGQVRAVLATHER